MVIGVGVFFKRLINFVESLYSAWTDEEGQEYTDHNGDTYVLLTTED